VKTPCIRPKSCTEELDLPTNGCEKLDASFGQVLCTPGNFFYKLLDVRRVSAELLVVYQSKGPEKSVYYSLHSSLGQLTSSRHDARAKLKGMENGNVLTYPESTLLGYLM
jgi:hypothetical protein